MIRLYQFVGRANNRWLITGLSTHVFDPRSQHRVGNVSEIPRYQIIGTVSNGDGNVGSIFGSLARYRSQIEKLPRECRCVIGCLKERHRLECR